MHIIILNLNIKKNSIFEKLPEKDAEKLIPFAKKQILDE
jgi:hypothetical protein